MQFGVRRLMASGPNCFMTWMASGLAPTAHPGFSLNSKAAQIGETGCVLFAPADNRCCILLPMRPGCAGVFHTGIQNCRHHFR